jgi:hypothetical protein
MNPTVLSLRCPRCGAALAGTQQDVAFWCGGCDVVQEVVGERFVERPCQMAEASSDRQGAVLYLLLWAFSVRSTCRWKDPEREALARHIPPVERVYVTGFRLHNPFYFGDLGLIFTERRVILKPIPEAPSGITVVGCGRGVDEAKAYVEPHLLTIIDRRVDVTGMDLECVIGDPVAWGIPFVDCGTDLVDGILGLRFPAAAVEAIEEVRACQGKRRP